MLTAMTSKLISMYTIIIFFTRDHVLMNDVGHNLHYKKHMLNLPAILNHEEERATILAELWFKKRKWTAVTGTGILCLIIAETIRSAVTGLLVTCLCNNRLFSGVPVFFANSFWISRKPRSFSPQNTHKNYTKKAKPQKISVCADEGTDVANKEQLPLVIRFVDKSGMIREEFLEFVLCNTSTSEQAIADKIKFTLEKLTHDLNDLRGQGYDGAGNMSGM